MKRLIRENDKPKGAIRSGKFYLISQTFEGVK